ncbi:MAG: HDOD domain-containing protein, partial [Gemmatimonadota bacterium]|nr:HDOD domain-containing protein [Gemmatimonadota bacterium]
MDKSNSDNGRSGKIREIIELVNKSPLSSIKQTMTEILRVIETESSNARDLKNTIEKDPPLCAGLLKIANSSSYGYPRTISDIQEAIICIGFDAVKELVLNQKLCELFRAGEHMNGYSRQSLWKHSAAVAVCSKMIFRREFRERGYNAYVAGLLHDIGIIVEDQLLRKEFSLALKLAAQSKNNLYCIENEVLLVNHADIGRAIAENWSFPVELGMSIGFHHEPDLV